MPRPTDAARRHAGGVLDRWLSSDEPPAMTEAQRDFEVLLDALAAAGVAPLADGPRARYLLLMAAAVGYGRAESEVLDALWGAADALGDLLDAADRAHDRLRSLAALLETKGERP